MLHIEITKNIKNTTFQKNMGTLKRTVSCQAKVDKGYFKKGF